MSKLGDGNSKTWQLFQAKLKDRLGVNELPLVKVKVASVTLVKANLVLTALGKPEQDQAVEALRGLCQDPESFGEYWSNLVSKLTPVPQVQS